MTKQAHTRSHIQIHSYEHTLLWLCTEEPCERIIVRGHHETSWAMATGVSAICHLIWVCTHGEKNLERWGRMWAQVHHEDCSFNLYIIFSFLFIYSHRGVFFFTMFINVSSSKSRSCFGGQFENCTNLNKSMSTIFKHMSAASTVYFSSFTSQLDYFEEDGPV